MCSAPPWKAGEKMRMNVVEFQEGNLLPKLLSQTNSHLPNPKPFHFHFSLSIIKTYLLTLMLKPRPPVACLRSTTVLCFRKWEFLIGKRILWTLKQYSGHELKCTPQAHLHLLGIHFLLCKPHPASVWLTPLWSVSGRHHRYYWSPHCTAKQFQILSVGIEKSIDI